MSAADLINLSIGCAGGFLLLPLFAGGPRQKTNFAYAIFASQGVLWALAVTLFRVSSNSTVMGVGAVLVYIIGSLVPILFLNFVSIVVEKKLSQRLRFFLLYLPFCIFSFFITATNSFIASIETISVGNHVNLGPIYIPWMAWFSIIMMIGGILLLSKYRKSTGFNRIQLQYILVSLAPTLLLSTPFNIILPYLGNYTLIWVGPISLALMFLIMAYAILRHRLFGIRFVIGNIVLYAALAPIHLFGFFGLNYIFAQVAGGIFNIHAVIFVALFSPTYTTWIIPRYRKALKKLVDRRLTYESFHPTETLNEYLKGTTSELNMDKLATRVITVIQKSLDVKNAGVILFDVNSEKVLFTKTHNFELNQMDDLLQIIQYWKDIGDDPILILEEVKSKGDLNTGKYNTRLRRVLLYMEKYKISAILPLNRRVQLNGIVLVGSKANKEALTVEETNFLESIIANTSVAMGRAILYKEVQDLNANLQNRVEQATHKIVAKNKELQTTLRKERDMIDIMGHELRTPASIIHMYFEQLMKEIDLVSEKSKNAKEIEKYAITIRSNITKEINLITCLLEVAKIDNQKLVLKREDSSALDIVESSIMTHKVNAEQKGLYLKFDKPENSPNFPLIYVDKIRFQEIMDNLVSNAIKYTVTGGATITLSHDDKFVTFTISDTGKGIPPSDIKSLGQKFYRAEQYTKESRDNATHIVRPGGTGLGLYVAKGLIKAHGGTLTIKSESDKGSIFSFTVPIFDKEKDVVNTQTEEKNKFAKFKIGHPDSDIVS